MFMCKIKVTVKYKKAGRGSLLCYSRDDVVETMSALNRQAYTYQVSCATDVQSLLCFLGQLLSDMLKGAKMLIALSVYNKSGL